MTWWISILFYLWQNSLRRWWEQPLSLLSKLVISGLLGLLGAIVILGVKHLGEQLDRQLRDREVLAVILSEIVPRESAAGQLLPDGSPQDHWDRYGNDIITLLMAGAFAQTADGDRIAIWASDNMESHGLLDDFYIFSNSSTEGIVTEFGINDRWSEALTRAPSEDIGLLLNDRDVLIGGVERLSPLLSNGFTRTVLMRAGSVDDIQGIHDVADVLSRLENRRIIVQSNLRILREIERLRNVQLQSLLWLTIGSSSVLGLVFGSLAWMEFREERYLLSLMRVFGVGRWTLLGHSVVENVVLAVAGVLLGFAVLHLSVGQLDLASLKLTWLGSLEPLYEKEGGMLIAGAAIGGLLSCIPIGIGLRKPLGLVLK